MSINPIRQKVVSFLTEAAYKEIEALDPESECAKQLSEITDIDATIVEEVKRICNAATLGEIMKSLLLARRLKKAATYEKEMIKEELSSIAEKLVKRVKTKSGQLELSEAGLHIFSKL